MLGRKKGGSRWGGYMPKNRMKYTQGESPINARHIPASICLFSRWPSYQWRVRVEACDVECQVWYLHRQSDSNNPKKLTKKSTHYDWNYKGRYFFLLASPVDHSTSSRVPRVETWQWDTPPRHYCWWLVRISGWVNRRFIPWCRLLVAQWGRENCLRWRLRRWTCG